jgi:hypothetical protein
MMDGARVQQQRSPVGKTKDFKNGHPFGFAKTFGSRALRKRAVARIERDKVGK